jgi:hypothetical protein
VRVALRAKIVLMAAEGLLNQVIAKALEVSRQLVGLERRDS